MHPETFFDWGSHVIAFCRKSGNTELCPSTPMELNASKERDEYLVDFLLAAPYSKPTLQRALSTFDTNGGRNPKNGSSPLLRVQAAAVSR
jgi:hypothetical protein